MDGQQRKTLTLSANGMKARIDALSDAQGYRRLLRDIQTSDVERWRKRAEEARTMADNTLDPVAKRGFLNVARTYDSMADNAEAKS